jgi:glycine/serine hydroxymethyltransferase
MGEVEVAQIADLIDTAMINRDDSNALGKVSREVADLCRKFPVYPAL